MSAGAPDVRSLLDRWGRAWGIPDLTDTVTVTFSPRLERSLGRCRPASGRITLADRLKSGNPVLLVETLCHEAAHVAAHRLSGGEAKPHGAEWQQLVRKVGFDPRMRMRAEDFGAPRRKIPRSTATPVARARYEHRCPVCQSVRFARRRVSNWVCAECTEVGLSGSLIISRLATPQAGATTDG